MKREKAVCNSAETAPIPQMDETAFLAIRQKFIRIYAYMNRTFSILKKDMEGKEISLLLFAAPECLLKVYTASDSFRRRLEEDGITRASRWSKDTTGDNAVTRGLDGQCHASSFGAQNRHTILQKYAIYFAPMLIKDTFYPFDTVGWCGVALLLPASEKNDAWSMLVSSIADGITMEYHASRIAAHYWNNEEMGVLDLGINYFNNKMIIYYRSRNIFDILKIPETDIMYKSAYDLFDPEPLNDELWAIVRGLKRLQNHPIRLSIRGRKRDFIISTVPYQQSNANVKGILLKITSEQRLSAHVSQKIGNTAVRTFDSIIGSSPGLLSAIEKGKRIAHTSANVMLLGESGVGKDIFAQALHNAGLRKNKPFIAVNCGALPRDLIASELFGYEGGAFTGAKHQGNMGKFELANGGTIFLDEIGELPLDLQATLLRVVEQRQFMRLGGKREIHTDVKIISATNVNLAEMIAQKRMRADLYYRLCAVHIDIPPLRARGTDIIELAEYFIQKTAAQNGRTERVRLSDDAKNLLMNLQWPGNVRELQNLMEGMVQLYPVKEILPEHILNNISSVDQHAFPVSPAPTAVWPAVNLPSAPLPGDYVKRRYFTQPEIEAALTQCHQNKSEAARFLGISRKTLYRYLRKYQLSDTET